MFSWIVQLYSMILQDFRLQDPFEYEEWYGQPHRAVDLQVWFIYLFELGKISFPSEWGL